MRRSRREDELLTAAARVFPGGVLGRHRLSDDKALVFSHGKGAHLFDYSGREYIDYTCGGGALLLGYDDARIVEAVREQLGRASQFISIVNEPAIQCAADLQEVIPCAEKVRFASTGAEAVMYALRLARAYTGREKIVKCEGAYHGFHDYAMWSYNPSDPPDFPKPVANTAGIPAAIAEQILITPYNDIATSRRIILDHAKEIAAIVVEPVQRFVPPRPEFLAGLKELSRELGIVLIFDETVTGFRIALGGAQERYGVVPDLAVYGKSLGGGLPLAAVVGRNEIMQLCDPRIWGADPRAVYLSGTLNGNPVVTAAGRAFLKAIRGENVYPPFFARAEALKTGLRQRITQLGLRAQVIGEGPMWHLVFTDAAIVDYRSSLQGNREQLLSFHYGLIEEGIFVRPGGGHYFSMAHTDDDVQITLEKAETVLRRIA